MEAREAANTQREQDSPRCPQRMIPLQLSIMPSQRNPGLYECGSIGLDRKSWCNLPHLDPGCRTASANNGGHSFQLLVTAYSAFICEESTAFALTGPRRSPNYLLNQIPKLLKLVTSSIPTSYKVVQGNNWGNRIIQKHLGLRRSLGEEISWASVQELCDH